MFFLIGAFLWTVLTFIVAPQVGVDIDGFIYAFGLVIGYAGMGLKIIKEWERLPVLLFGKYVRTAGPGIDWVDPVLHTCLDRVSIQDQVMELDIDSVQTKDNVPIALSLAVTYKIDEANVRNFTVTVADGVEAMLKRAIAAATECVGKSKIDELLHSRDQFAGTVGASLAGKVKNWGVTIDAVELTDIKITDPSIEQAIALKAKAQKEADAELERAERQAQIARHLSAAASEYSEDAWRLKNLETLIELCRSAENNTILIGSDLLKGFSDLIPDKSLSLPSNGTRAKTVADSTLASRSTP